MNHTGWIAVDLDGTLAEYDGWQGITKIGKPIPLMAERVVKWIVEGKDVRIFTARVGPQRASEEEQASALKAIQDWCLDHIGIVLPVTATKDFGMIELWDDRAVRVKTNTGERCCEL